MRDFLEISDIGEFIRLAGEKDIIIRIDPFLMVFHYGLIFYINLFKLSADDRRIIINRLKHKIIYVKEVKQERGISEFIKKWEKEAGNIV